MADDIEAFNALESGKNDQIIRIYSWKPRCISLGYSQNIEEEIELRRAKEYGWDVVQRPTGGGIVFHNEAEVTYSLIIVKDRLPDGLVPSYLKISEAVICALGKLGMKVEISKSKVDSRKLKVGLCFSYPEGYEIVADGKKIVGAAQKRGKRALLQQGSIFVRSADPLAFSVLKKDHEKQNAISIEEVLGRVPSFDELSRALISGFQEGLGLEI